MPDQNTPAGRSNNGRDDVVGKTAPASRAERESQGQPSEHSFSSGYTYASTKSVSTDQGIANWRDDVVKASSDVVKASSLKRTRTEADFSKTGSSLF